MPDFFSNKLAGWKPPQNQVEFCQIFKNTYFLDHLRTFLSASIWSFSKSPIIFISSRQEVFCKKDILRNFAKFTWVSFLLKLQDSVCNFIKKETLAQVFSCEFCEISKNTYFTEHVWTTASIYGNFYSFQSSGNTLIIIERLLKVYKLCSGGFMYIQLSEHKKLVWND